MPASDIRQAFLNDFRSAWNAVAQTKTTTGHGNFMFAFVAVNYLEWAASLAHQDRSIWSEFSRQLMSIERRYFVPLPGKWPTRPESWFPVAPKEPAIPLLWAAFDLVRNGIAHRYQQIDAELSDGSRFRVQLMGAELKAYPTNWAKDTQRSDHFAVAAIPARREVPAFLIVRVHPDVLLADVDGAVEASGLVRLPPLPFLRKYTVTHDAVVRALVPTSAPPSRGGLAR